jgi:glucose-1-phosphate cytidylyltransferase
MKVVILVGGKGTRISEESVTRPKPMIEIGGRPILHHIMKTYAHYGCNEFILCLGYKGYMIKEYFLNYHAHMSDLTISTATGEVTWRENRSEDWTVTLVDTGEDTQTGGRLGRVREYLRDEEAFCFTYGDGVCDVDIGKVIDFHKRNGRLATVTAVQPPGRFGAVDIDPVDHGVREFQEKPIGDGGWINGGYFVLSPKVLDLITSDQTIWEDVPLRTLARDDQLSAYQHRGFWRPMDTLRDKTTLEDLWERGVAPWKVWG